MFALVLYWTWSAGAAPPRPVPLRLCVTDALAIGLFVSEALPDDRPRLSIAEEKFDCE